MKAPASWDYNTGSPVVVIQSNDTGVDYTHPDLGDNIWQNLGEDADGDGQVLQQIEGEWAFDPGDSNGVDDDSNGYIDDFVGWDFFHDHNQPSPVYGSQHSHGTSTSGTAVQVGNNSIDGVGVSWSSKVMAANTSYRSGNNVYISGSSAISAIYYAIDNGADIINMSWGSFLPSSSIRTTLMTAYNSNLVLVAAAMHTTSGGTNGPYYPAAWEHVIGVTSVNLDDTKSTIVQYGDWVSVSAPRFDYSTRWSPDGHTVAYYAGQTSTSAPYTSGLATLIISEYPTITNQLVYSIIENSTDDIREANAGEDWENLMGTGRINAEKALQLTQFVQDNGIDEILSGNIDTDIEGNVLLINKVKIVNDLNVVPEAIVFLYPGTRLSILNDLNIEGTFIAHGTEEEPIRIVGVGRSDFRSNNANFSLSNVHFENMWINWFTSSNGSAINCSFNHRLGTIIEGGNSFYFQNCNFNSGIVGLGVSARPGEPANNVVLENCIIENSDFGLVISYRAITMVNNCTIRNNSWGILADGFAQPCLLQYGSNYGCAGTNNVIIDNHVGVKIIQDAQPWLGIYSEHTTSYLEGHNRLDNYIDIDNSTAHQRPIYAQANNWYSGAGCNQSFPNNLNSPVIWEPTVYDIYNSDPPIWDDQIVLLMEAGGNYAAAAALYQQKVEEDPTDSAALWALAGVTRCLEKNDQVQELIDLLDTYISNYPGTALEEYASSYKISTYILNGEFDLAQNMIELFNTTYPNSELASNKQYESLILAELQNTGSQGKMIPGYRDVIEDGYRSLAQDYPETGVGILASIKLGQQSNENPVNTTPQKFLLASNYPNPFNPTTTIRYGLPESSDVSVIVYDITGREIIQLVDSRVPAGDRRVVWNGRDQHGNPVASGLYIYRLVAKSNQTKQVFTQSNKMVLMK